MNTKYYLNQDELDNQHKEILREKFDEARKVQLDVMRETSAPEKDTVVDSTKLKLEINEIVWRNCSSETTLEKAEEMASNFWQAIMETHL